MRWPEMLADIENAQAVGDGNRAETFWGVFGRRGNAAEPRRLGYGTEVLWLPGTAHHDGPRPTTAPHISIRKPAKWRAQERGPVEKWV